MFLQRSLKRSDEVLRQLDDCSSHFMFPVLDNGYVYLAAARMSVYANPANWAIIIEVVGYSPRAWQTDRFNNCLHCYGNALVNKPGINNSDFIFPIDNGLSAPLFRENEPEIISPLATDLKIRGNVFSRINDHTIYLENGINLEEDAIVNAFELLRLLSVMHRNLLFATDEELKTRMSRFIPMLLRLDEWHHPDVANGEKPSENETFKQIAKLIETLDTNAYEPSKSPNTHWSHWPSGGTL